ncbi:MAG TPA: biopolymer transporter ExbD [Bryobacteraceae bacterium]|jgi:Biopolymer transport protein|nr:biopolymer transporter ExbD [Bryobacteraceae bacterium]
MAFSFNHRNGGRHGRRFSSLGAMSEINIVPLVDVVLVLLIIFMITANVMEFGLNINVPEVRVTRDSTQELPVVNISKSGELYLNNTQVNLNALPETIRGKFHGAKAAYVRADKETPWDPIAQVISVLGQSKIECRMVTKPLSSAFRKR